MDETPYVYQADDADIALWEANFTSRNADGSGDSEANFRDAVLMGAAGKAGGRFLDVGSGHGRIIDWLKPYAASMIGVEPDAIRFESCANTFRNDKDIEVLNVTTGHLRNRGMMHCFDYITASMVVQHVSTRTCQGLLDDVRALLARDGIAIVATTHFPQERFTYQNDPHAKTREEYDLYADRTESQGFGLPVRMFSRTSFETAIEQAGLTIVAWQQFSYAQPDKLEGVAALYAIAAEELRNCGISQFALVRHREQPAPRPWWHFSR